MNKFFLLPITVFHLSLLFFLPNPAWSAQNCSTAKEFITSLEFLRGKKDLAIPENQTLRLANQIAEGCTGAAQRFIRVYGILAHSGLASNDSIATALIFSKRSDQETDTFTTVFKMSFLEEYLDLDLRSAMKLALALSVEFSGDIAPVRDDFSKLVNFCVRKSDLNLPRPQCATFAARLTKIGTHWRGGVAEPFMELLDYTRSSKGPGLILGQALALTEEVIAAGPGAPDNFLQAYRYAISPKGLTMTQQDALAFARKMANRKLVPEKEAEEPLKENPRKP